MPRQDHRLPRVEAAALCEFAHDDVWDFRNGGHFRAMNLVRFAGTDLCSRQNLATSPRDGAAFDLDRNAPSH
jgi:hypothetical protein